MAKKVGRIVGHVALLIALLSAAIAQAQPEALGPYNARFLAGGEGLGESIDPQHPLLGAQSPWSITAWIRSAETLGGTVLVGGVGDPGRDGRHLGLRDGKPMLRIAGAELVAKRALQVGKWHQLTASYDGKHAELFVDGVSIRRLAMNAPAASATLQLAPTSSPWQSSTHFAGEIAEFSIAPAGLSASDVRKLAAQPPRFDLIHFADISVGWPWQVKQQAGLPLPQAAATLPVSKAPFPAATAIDEPSGPALREKARGAWAVANWRLAEAPRIKASGAELSSVGFEDAAWHRATVPGTVLTTLVNRGVYPDPDYGLNNMAIPESLARQDYWYRAEFPVAAELSQRRLILTFNGINYRAEVWFNGTRLGSITGAFMRGVFDITGRAREGANAIAVRVSPPPHPGIPHEQSIKAGPGENGGAMALDGPTFIATEGWDWIPGIRDRNTGLWQDVVLSVSGPVRIRDPQVLTQLPLPDTSRATVTINVPLENATGSPVAGTLTAAFEGVNVSKQVTLAPGLTTVKLAPEEFAQLALTRPRLWWPNGYGSQELYGLQLEFAAAGQQSDSRVLRFGIRQITYELSLFDAQGRLRRVDADVALGSARGERLIDVRHESLKKSPLGWAASLYPGALQSPAVRSVADESLTPHLAIKVNGVRIASRGGNWGMDDSRKRVSRERLEPYFRLHREANLNTIRNWVGLNYEDEFFDLADEYGMLVLSDFWASTQDFQVEPQDPALFLANARDTILRYRNHPSIALWFGRNEGVPQPILNEGLADLVAEVDGTRHFTGSSNRVNLQGSGPYNYRPPSQYFTELAEGYSVEVGTPSLATLESLRAWLPAADQWPISDALAYHDWHHGGNGDIASFMRTLETQFGAATDLEDFERKAQMMNYVTHRAMFEGFHAHLWKRNSGRLLWMTHPAWPSNMWQIYSSDYDTHASFYGAKKACEPVHVQMNLPDFGLAVVNTTRHAASGLALRARVLSLDNRVLAEQTHRVDSAANAVTSLPALDLGLLLTNEPVVLVKLELAAPDGRLVSENLYWQGRDDASYRALNDLPRHELQMRAATRPAGDEVQIVVTLENPGKAPALANKLVLLDSAGKRVLPAYYSDNYVSLLPGERREIVIAHPATSAPAASVALRGWNTQPTSVAIGRR